MKANLKWSINLAIVIIIGACLIFLFMGKKTFMPMIVMSGSMRPYLNPGDMIISRKVDPNQVKVGTVITYKYAPNRLITHRVIDVSKENDEPSFRTKGDANNIEDEKRVLSNQLIGQVVFNIPYGGYVAKFIKSKIGFLLIIIIPSIIFIGKEIKAVALKIK